MKLGYIFIIFALILVGCAPPELIRELSETSVSDSSPGSALALPPGPPDATQTTLVATGPVVADTTSTSTITLTLKDANGTAIPNYTISSITASGTRNSFPITCGTITDSAGQIICSLASAKAEIKTITLEVSAGTTFKTTTSTFTQFKRDLQVPYELCDTGAASNTSDTFFHRCGIKLDTNDFDGDTVTYEFEVSAGNSNVATPYKVYLTNDDNTANLAEVTIPANTARTRQKVAFTPTVGSNNYRLKTEATASGNNLKVYLARILISQVQATKTKIFIPLGGNDYVPLQGIGTQLIFSTSTTWANNNYFSVWKKDLSNFTGITGNAFTFFAIGRKSAGASSFTIGLYNRTSATPVTGASMTFTTNNNPYDIKTASFASSAAGFTNSELMEARLINGAVTTSGHIFKAGLYIALDNLAKLEVYHRIALQRDTAADFVNSFSKYAYSSTANPNAIAYFEGSSLSDVDLDCSYSLIEAAADNAAAGAAVVGSTISVGTSKAVSRTSSLNLLNGKVYFLNVDLTTSTSCKVINPFMVLYFNN